MKFRFDWLRSVEHQMCLFWCRMMFLIWKKEQQKFSMRFDSLYFGVILISATAPMRMNGRNFLEKLTNVLRIRKHSQWLKNHDSVVNASKLNYRKSTTVQCPRNERECIAKKKTSYSITIQSAGHYARQWMARRVQLFWNEIMNKWVDISFS